MSGILEMYESIGRYNKAAANRYLLLVNHPYYRRSTRRKWRREPGKCWVPAQQN